MKLIEKGFSEIILIEIVNVVEREWVSEFEEINEERIDAVLYLIKKDDSLGEKNCSYQSKSCQ